jgi:hypothetical protein
MGIGLPRFWCSTFKHLTKAQGLSFEDVLKVFWFIGIARESYMVKNTDYRGSKIDKKIWSL